MLAFMSTVPEIEAAIAKLPPAGWLEIRQWMDVHAPLAAATNGVSPNMPAKSPDFLARQKAIFGDRILSDSQTLLDESRAERF